MELLAIAAGIAVVYIIYQTFYHPKESSTETERLGAQFFYRPKASLMTASEAAFLRRLNEVTGERYDIFPQIHLSSLMTNETKGRYRKLGFQRINRMSVDYVLCDKQTLKPVYAVELDDPTHNKPARRARDAAVNKIFADIHLPLVRFSDYRSLSSEDIAQRFYEASVGEVDTK